MAIKTISGLVDIFINLECKNVQHVLDKTRRTVPKAYGAPTEVVTATNFILSKYL